MPVMPGLGVPDIRPARGARLLVHGPRKSEWGERQGGTVGKRSVSP